MADGLKLVSVFVWISCLYVLGIFFFSRGFLLKRYVIPDKSNCSDIEYFWGSNEETRSAAQEGCWTKRKYSRAVLIIIDALRFDFAYYNQSLLKNETLPFQNKLEVLHEVLTQRPEHGRLYRFIADPPTTTMQRLKGLTTGSLPTFVDAGSNFASYEIAEDNLISQLVAHGKNVTFMGDDTWKGLFPNLFYKSFPFPSFDVKDLDTVDRGIIEHLVPELNQGDSDVVIAHFLGVDHCGHRYGPYHPAMADKLKQMDEMLRSVINVLSNDSVLFVLGDHGMTRSGDHGGDSDDEVSAALFVYSAKPLVPVLSQQGVNPIISQIDLVPTIASALGLPIPFSNLGTVISGLFPKEVRGNVGGQEGKRAQQLADSIERTSALYANAYQVDKYLTAYSKASAEMPGDALVVLSRQFQQLNKNISQLKVSLKMHSESPASAINSATLVEKLMILEESYIEYLSHVKRLCQSLWATFDMWSIACGIVLLLTTMFTAVVLTFEPSFVHSNILPIVKSSVIFFLVGILAVTLFDTDLPYHLLWLFALAESSNIGVLYIFWKTRNKSQRIGFIKAPTPDTIAATVICALYMSAFFSNSFVVNEDKIVSYFVQSLVTVFVGIQIWRGPKDSPKTPRNANKKVKEDVTMASSAMSALWLLLVLLVFEVCGRIALVFKACREEQVACTPSSFLQPLSALIDPSSTANYRFLLTVFSIGILPFALQYCLRCWGNLNGSSFVVFCVKYTLPAGAVLICAHWALQIVPQSMSVAFPSIIVWQQVIFPQLAYWMCLVTVACLLWKPICAYIFFRDHKYALENHSLSDSLDLKTVQMLFQEVKATWDKREEKKTVPLVYGLATIYSAALLVLSTAIVLPLMMVLGDGLAVTVLLLVIQMTAVLEMLRCNLRSTADCNQGACWSVVFLWGLLSSYYFYCTGHQATLSSVRFEAAFVGLPGNMDNFVLPVFLVLLNTFAAQIICTVSLPLLLFWPMTPRRFLTDNRTAQRVVEKGEYVFHERPQHMKENIFRLMLRYQLYHALKLFAAVSAASLHRRHLMVWKIFAPRFIFEAASFVVISLVLLCIFMFVLRIDSSLRLWTERLQKQCENEL